MRPEITCSSQVVYARIEMEQERYKEAVVKFCKVRVLMWFLLP